MVLGKTDRSNPLGMEPAFGIERKRHIHPFYIVYEMGHSWTFRFTTWGSSSDMFEEYFVSQSLDFCYQSNQWQWWHFHQRHRPKTPVPMPGAIAQASWGKTLGGQLAGQFHRVDPGWTSD